ncbi:MAG: hypothetical protein AAF571_03970 [Verrucomicrobiota bacterium]
MAPEWGFYLLKPSRIPLLLVILLAQIFNDTISTLVVDFKNSQYQFILTVRAPPPIAGYMPKLVIAILLCLAYSLPAPEVDRAFEIKQENEALFKLFDEIVIPPQKVTDQDPFQVLQKILDEVNQKLPQDKQIEYFFKSLPKPNSSQAGEGRLITLNTQKMSLSDALSLCTQLAHIRYRALNGRLYMWQGYISSVHEPEYIIFSVPPEFLKLEDKEKTRVEVKEQLNDYGVIFGDDSFAYYLPEKNLLVIKNSLEQNDLVEQLIKHYEQPNK